MKTTTPKVKKKILVQISWAVCILFLGSNIIEKVGSIWGFQQVAEQIAGTFVAFALPIETVFIGKMLADKDREAENETKD